jgi:hypothetical protein
MQILSLRGTVYATLEIAERAGIRFVSSDMPAVLAVNASCPFSAIAPFDWLPATYWFEPPFEYRAILGFDLLQDHELEVNLRCFLLPPAASCASRASCAGSC